MGSSTVIVSYSELSDFRQCPHKHMLGYRERWQTSATSPALAKGTLWHKVMEAHYRAKMALQSGDTRLEQQHLAELSVLLYGENGGEFQDLIRWMYEGYLDHYGVDPDWKILAVEHASEIWLPTPRGGRSRFKLKIKADLIVRWKGNNWLVDHKSGKDLPKDKELEIDDQFGLYTWAMKQMGRKVFGSIYNAARTQRNKTPGQTLDSRFQRVPMYRTDAELKTIAIEAYQTAKRAYSIPAGEAERAPDTDRCTWRCNFLEPCLAGRKGIDERVFLSEKGYVQNYERH